MEERLSKIEQKVDSILAILEGKYGAEGLLKQIYQNRDDIMRLKMKLYKFAGIFSVVFPLIIILIRAK